jgi:hypothetical protein
MSKLPTAEEILQKHIRNNALLGLLKMKSPDEVCIEAIKEAMQITRDVTIDKYHQELLDDPECDVEIIKGRVKQSPELQIK